MSTKPRLRLLPFTAAVAALVLVGGGGVAMATTPAPDTSTTIVTTETPEEVVEAPPEAPVDTPEETVPEPATEAAPENDEPVNDTPEAPAEDSTEPADEAVTEETESSAPAETTEEPVDVVDETPATDPAPVTQTGILTVSCERDDKGELTGFQRVVANSDNTTSSEENTFVPSESMDGGEFFDLDPYTRTVPAGETGTADWYYGYDYPANIVSLRLTSGGVVLYKLNVDPKGCVPPADKVDYGTWQDGMSDCETGTVEQARTVRTTPYVFTDGEWVLDIENASVTNEYGSRDMTEEELAKCEGPPVEADNTFTAVADQCDDSTSPTGTGSIAGTFTNTDDETDKSVPASVKVLDITDQVVDERDLGVVNDGITVPFEFASLYLGPYTVQFFEAGVLVKEIPVDVALCDIVQPELAPVDAVGGKCYANFTNPVDNPESVKIPYGSFDNDEPDGTIEVKPGKTVKVETTRAQLDYIAYGAESYADAGSGSVKVSQECGVTPTPKPPVPPKVDDPRQPPFVQPVADTEVDKVSASTDPQRPTKADKDGVGGSMLPYEALAALTVAGAAIIIRRRLMATAS